MRKILFLLLLVPSVIWADLGNELFYRAQSDTSVVLRGICVPTFTGEEIFALDFDDTNLTISIAALGDGTDTVFTYTAGDIDNYDGTPPAWGAPAASALELDARNSGCVDLHIRDEVFAVAGATEWHILFTDSTTNAFMDSSVAVLALGTSDDIQASSEAALTAFGASTESNVNDTKAFASTAASASASADAGIISLAGAVGDPVGDDISADIAAAQAGLDPLQGLVLQQTTIATLASQVSFTLTEGSPDDNAYNTYWIQIVDQSTATQKAVGRILAYTGSTKTVTLRFDPGIFTMATGDLVYIMAN